MKNVELVGILLLACLLSFSKTVTLDDVFGDAQLSQLLRANWEMLTVALVIDSAVTFGLCRTFSKLGSRIWYALPFVIVFFPLFAVVERGQTIHALFVGLSFLVGSIGTLSGRRLYLGQTTIQPTKS